VALSARVAHRFDRSPCRSQTSNRYGISACSTSTTPSVMMRKSGSSFLIFRAIPRISSSRPSASAGVLCPWLLVKHCKLERAVQEPARPDHVTHSMVWRAQTTMTYSDMYLIYLDTLPAAGVLLLRRVVGALIHGSRHSTQDDGFLPLKSPPCRNIELLGKDGLRQVE